MKEHSSSAKTYAGLVGFLIMVKIVFLIFPTAFPEADQEGAFSWTTIAVISLAGLIGLILSHRTDFPDIWDGRVSTASAFSSRPSSG